MGIDRKFDVALSFAGEDRLYVREVAEILSDSDVRVFYDEFEEAKIWGKDLYTYLREVYTEDARYTIMFCSKHYAGKLWTTHERESAQERALEENIEYILPARFDDTKIPGLPATVAYIDLRKKTPYDFSGIVCQKLGKKLLSKRSTKLQSAAKKLRAEEQELSIIELEKRNEQWDAFHVYMESLDDNDAFVHAKVNSLHYLTKYGVSVQEVKNHLRLLGYFDGPIDNEFTENLAKSVKRFQKLRNMRHVDGIIGELTLSEMQRMVGDLAKPKR